MLLALLALLAQLVALGWFHAPPALGQEAPGPGRTQLHAVDAVPYPDVRSISQDDQGFIWIGVNHVSEGGLLRFDGLDTVRYRARPGDASSLSHGQVFLTYIDNDQSLWAGTIRGGLNRYDPLTDTFTQFLHDPNDPTSIPSDDIKSMLQSSDGTHWVGTIAGLARFDSSTGRFTSFVADPDDPNSLPHNAVDAIAEDPTTGHLWLGTRAGLAVFDPVNETFRTYSSGDDPSSLSNDRVSAVRRDAAGVWWIGTADGLNRYDPQTDSFARITHRPDDPTSLGSGDITSLLEDSQGRFWVGHAAGLDLFDRDLEAVVPFVNAANRSEVLGSGRVQALFEDDRGAIWIGSQTAGLSRISPLPASVEYLRHQPGDPATIGSDFVARATAINDDELWLVTDVGVESYDGSTFTDHTDRLGLEGGWPQVHAVLPTDDGTVWIGSNAGVLTRIDPSGERREFPVPAPGDSSAVWPVAQGEDGSVWFRSPFGNGVGVVRPTGVIELLIGESVDEGPEQVYAFNTSQFYDRDKQQLWVTGLGLARIDMATADVQVYSFDPTNPGSVLNQLWSVDRGPDGTLWLASSNGVHEFDPSAGEYVALHRDDLPITGVTDGRFDADGTLWLVSGPTLTGWNVQTGGIVVPAIRDDSAAGEHLDLASWVASKFVLGPDNRLYAPTLDRGMVVFTPADAEPPVSAPPVVLTGLELFGDDVQIGGDDGILSAPVNRTEQLELAHDQDSITFEFAALDFEHPDAYTYRYRLDGFDSDWQLTDATRRSATYTNLNPGSYTFEAQVSDRAGAWLPGGLAVDLTVDAPWYATSWARALQALAVVGGVVALFTWRTARHRRRERDLERELGERSRHAEERERLMSAVQEQSDRLQSILAAAPIGVMLLGPDRGVIVANPLAEAELESLAELSPAAKLQRFADVPIDDLIKTGSGETPMPATVVSGSPPRILSVITRPIEHSDDAPRGWVLLWEDVTERRENEQRAARRDRLVAVGQFAAGIAHDVNNLLTVIGLNAELLDIRPEIGDEVRARVQAISDTTDSAARIMRQVLDYSRPRQNAPDPLDVTALVRSQLDELRTLVHPTLTFESDRSDAVVARLDPVQVERVVHNLVMNSHDATLADGTIAVSVQRWDPDLDRSTSTEPHDDAGSEEPAGGVKLVVVDNGSGIEADVLPTIFEPFATTKPAGLGSGLGLAQVAGIAAEHGGTVEVESTPGEGCTFRVYLAAAPDPTVGSAVRPTPAATGDTPP